jgi:release factor glutamine methyltransferase
MAREEHATEVRDALGEGISLLRDANVPSHTLAAELLLMHALACDRTWLYSHPRSVIESPDAEKYFALIERRAAGEPTQYLTGKQEFWGLEFEVNPRVLIPRPETEHVVEVALARLAERGRRANGSPQAQVAPLRIAEVGTGSGCMAIALARELPEAEILATDISGEALEVARRNARRHGVRDRVHFVQCNLLEGFAERAGTMRRPYRDSDAAGSAGNFDLIASNPPYVARDEAEMLAREVREHEPQLALFGGAAGTGIYARLIEQAASVMRPGGTLVLELGYNSAPHVRSLLVAKPTWAAVEITNDLAGIPRVISAEKT